VNVRFTRRALSDLSRILDYLDERSPREALNVKLAIRRAVEAIGAIQPSDARRAKAERAESRSPAIHISSIGPLKQAKCV
jgi:plasmid stabilization system protein ParE